MCIYFNCHKNWEARSFLRDFAQAENSNFLGHGSPTFLCQRATPVIVLLSAGSRAARGKISESDKPKCLNYCKIWTTERHTAQLQPPTYTEHSMDNSGITPTFVNEISPRPKNPVNVTKLPPTHSTVSNAKYIHLKYAAIQFSISSWWCANEPETCRAEQRSQ
jgi:hypothetical protein